MPFSQFTVSRILFWQWLIYSVASILIIQAKPKETQMSLKMFLYI